MRSCLPYLAERLRRAGGAIEIGAFAPLAEAAALAPGSRLRIETETRRPCTGGAPLRARPQRGSMVLGTARDAVALAQAVKESVR